MAERKSHWQLLKQRAADRKIEIVGCFSLTVIAYLLDLGGAFRFGLLYFFAILPIRLMVGSRR